MYKEHAKNGNDVTKKQNTGQLNEGKFKCKGTKIHQQKNIAEKRNYLAFFPYDGYYSETDRTGTVSVIQKSGSKVKVRSRA